MTAEIKINFKSESGIVPEYKTHGSAGLDISSNQDSIIKAGKWAMITTGIFVEIPDGYEIQVRSRSGLAAKNGIFVLNSPGTIDSDYRGEIQVILANFSDIDFQINKGDRIAQLVVASVVRGNFVPVTEISETKRGTGGFGHTGI